MRLKTTEVDIFMSHVTAGRKVARNCDRRRFMADRSAARPAGNGKKLSYAAARSHHTSSPITLKYVPSRGIRWNSLC
jgi:hypothetical protein